MTRPFRLLKTLLSYIPSRTARIPYALTYHCILWATGLSRACLWPRNSYYFDRLVLFVSDLDLTFLISKKNALSLKMKKRLLRTQRLFPLMGELNIVHEEMVLRHARILPVLELRRDPILLRAVLLNQKKLEDVQQAEKFFFLWRMLWSDRKNLREKLQFRERKWTFHLESLNLDSDIFLKARTFAKFLEGLDSEFSCSLGYLQQLPLEQENRSGVLRDELKLVFFISEWLGEVYREKRWEKEEEWPVLGPKLHSILNYSLSWEVWGVLTQFELQRNLREFYTHIIGLKKISSFYSFECYLPALLEVEGLVLERMALSS